MTGRRGRTVAEPPPLIVNVDGDILMLSPGGVSIVGTWTACEICDDQEDDRG